MVLSTNSIWVYSVTLCRATYFCWKGDLKARKEVHGFTRNYMCTKPLAIFAGIDYNFKLHSWLKGSQADASIKVEFHLNWIPGAQAL